VKSCLWNCLGAVRGTVDVDPTDGTIVKHRMGLPLQRTN